ncbi:glycerol-3-phosphate acyltransferase PlsY [Pullulanibacillus pueri]|uniref:Glycerol-3-phosphate acyltransferase n=2 Tax=Pullulanibacillus pueri TaxID=1437324 RepID=A0A8J2ZVC0_9BACL|nr:glycerol-3-phosphate acyltransferase PlsY [Pullulanibacillus pueri]GGH79032.1 glycerol-3-phosphate acyltransferase [Pullulanibacillus pueri]
MVMFVVLSCVVSYLLGAISFSYIFTKWIKKVDIREHGSGNAGATNTARVLGTGPAIGVLILDVLKGVVAVLISMAFHLPDWGIALSGLCAILGHIWPVYYGFKGGKGVATTIAVFLMLMWLPTLIVAIIAILLIALTRYVSLGSLVFILTPIAGLAIGGYPSSYIIVSAIIALLLLWKHRANIQRLVQGNESKFGSKSK